MIIKINDKEFELIKNVNDGYSEEELANKLTDYFDSYDYICGDWAYGKLRLKGFNDKGNKGYKKINDIDNLDKYINDYCAYGCKWFLIKKKG